MKRYAKNDIIWELFNEPNYHFQNGSAGYANCLLALGKALKKDPVLKDEILVGPAMGQFNLYWIQHIGDTGGLEYLDGISAHPYRAEGPETVLGSWQMLRNKLSAYGKEDMPILSGEWGWPSCVDENNTPVPCSGGGGDKQAISEHEQASRLARQWLTNDIANVSISIWYDWHNDGTNRAKGESNFGTVHHEYNNETIPYLPKPGYKAALALQKHLGSLRYSQRINVTNHDDVYVLEY
eukprot:UN32274